MRIAFYAPLKPPWHPVPSGDRLMARLLIAALSECGHQVNLVSELRTFSRAPAGAKAVEHLAKDEIDRIRVAWHSEGKPDVFFCYHPYYKSPDLLGPHLCREFGIPYVTAEASYSPRRDQTEWARSQSFIMDSIGLAAVNITFTERDRLGLVDALPSAKLARLKPFIDVSSFRRRIPDPGLSRLVTVAMMRDGDKFESYKLLADALSYLPDTRWCLAVIGDGPRRADVEALFQSFGKERLEWLGEKNADAVADELSRSSLYVWPGCGEAYGLAYLEAQAAGLPVVAFHTAGVPAVVDDGITGILVREGDVKRYSNAIVELLIDDGRRSEMGRRARNMVLTERSIETAAKEIDSFLHRALEGRNEK